MAAIVAADVLASAQAARAARVIAQNAYAQMQAGKFGELGWKELAEAASALEASLWALVDAYNAQG